MAEDFDFTGDEARIFGAGGAAANLAAKAENKFVASRLGFPDLVWSFRLAHDLDEPFTVPQVDEDDAAVVPAAMHPSAQGDNLIQFGRGDFSAIVSTHGQR